MCRQPQSHSGAAHGEMDALTSACRSHGFHQIPAKGFGFILKISWKLLTRTWRDRRGIQMGHGERASLERCFGKTDVPLKHPVLKRGLKRRLTLLEGVIFLLKAF